MSENPGSFAADVAFGRAVGYMDGAWMDVQGVGIRLRGPKDGDPAEYPTGHSPQGDAIRLGERRAFDGLEIS